MLRGGVIMDVVTPEQAKIAEDAGAVAVMALERVPADIRRDGGVARMSDPAMIEGIQAAVTIPVMAKCRIGHFAEAQVLEALGVDYIDESEVLTPADEAHHVDKWAFTVPFVCGATNLGEALRRISEGACMIRSKGEAGTGNIVEAVRHLRSILGDIRRLTVADEAELFGWAKELRAPVELVQEVAERGELPVPLFCAGGIATPADAALVMQLGAQAVFVGSGIFKSADPPTHGQGDRRGHHALRRRHHRGQGVARSRRGDARRGDRHPRRQARRPRLVSASRGLQAMKVGVLALQGAFREHREVLDALGVEAVEVRTPEQLGALDALILPGGESTTMSKLLDTSALRAPLADAAGRRPARVRHVRGHDPAGARRGRRPPRPGVVRRHRRRGAPQRVRPPARLVRGRRSTVDGLAGGPFPGVFIRAPRIEQRGRRRRGARPVRRPSRARPPGHGVGRQLPSRAVGRPPAARAVPVEHATDAPTEEHS